MIILQSYTKLKAIIIDFGKTCELGNGKRYSLTQQEKEWYKVHHPQIAPDLSNGHDVHFQIWSGEKG